MHTLSDQLDVMMMAFLPGGTAIIFLAVFVFAKLSAKVDSE